MKIVVFDKADWDGKVVDVPDYTTSYRIARSDLKIDECQIRNYVCERDGVRKQIKAAVFNEVPSSYLMRAAIKYGTDA
ncbi:hypothetical protein [Enterobacter intestinihominis]|uniref:hypothetical protein n=1 Tax=Enterobacter intestinihominis TaxID=3133180 RepID=UPI003B24BFE6